MGRSVKYLFKKLIKMWTLSADCFRLIKTLNVADNINIGKKEDKT